MKRVVMVVAAAWMTVAGAGEKPAWLGRIRRDHPRMFFNKDTWSAVKARAEGPAREARDALLKRCDGYPDNPVCTGTGAPKDRPGLTVDPVHTGIPSINEWGTQSAECALAWRFTGEAKYLAKAKAMLLANVKGYAEAYANRRAVTWYSTTRVNSLCAYDWIYEALTDDERRAIIVPLVRHCEDVQPRPGRPAIRRRNTGGVKAGCYGVKNLMWYAGLAALGDGFCDELAESLIVEGHAFHQEVLKFRSDSAGDDGALGTGTPGYAMGVYPVGHFNVFHTWLSATGENLAGRYRPMALYPNWVWWMWIPDAARPDAPLFLGYGDGDHANNRLPVGGMYEHLLQYIHFFKEYDPDAARLAATIAEMCPNHVVGSAWRGGSGFPAYPFLFGKDKTVKPFTREELSASPVKARQFEQLGQIFMRSGWAPDSTYALLVGGTLTPMHKHHDEGSFVIYKHDFLALDSGSRAAQTDWNLKYYYGQSVAHNVVLIQKPGEPLPGYWGPGYKGPEGKNNYGGMYGLTGEVVAFETNDSYSYAAVDTGALYGEKCTENVRQFVHVQPDYFVVYDRVGASDPSYAKQWLLHTQNKPVVEGRTVRADSRDGRLFCEALLPKDATIELVGGPGKEFWANGKNWEIYDKWMEGVRRQCAKDGRGPYWGEWRAETHPGAPRADDRFLHVLTAADVKTPHGIATRLVEEANRDGVTLVIPASREGRAAAQREGRAPARPTYEITLLFNRTGKVGGEIRIVGKDAEGRILSSSSSPLAETVTPQKGVLLK